MTEVENPKDGGAVSLAPVLPDMLDRIWPTLRPIVEKTLANVDTSTAEDVYAEVSEGRSGLWIAVDGEGKPLAFLTHVIWNYPQKKALRITRCGGSGILRWIHLLSEIEDFGRHVGCAFMEVVARKGYVRFLPDYQMTHVLMRREL